MKRIIFAILFTILSVFPAISVFADSDHVRIRTFAAMEPYGRMSVKNWVNTGGVQLFDCSYGFTPGLEIFGVLNERVELGGGFRYQVARRVLRADGASDERFSYIPLYAAGRFDIIESYGINMYGIVKLGYNFLVGNKAFYDIWNTESPGDPLVSTGGGFYGGASLGVVFTILQKENWGLDWSMDAGYSYHGGTGRNTSEDGFDISYQVLSVDFSLDWRF